jgi:hypothetical protein
MGIPLKRINTPEITPVRIDNFLGINKSDDGTTELKLGEAIECINWRVTDKYNLKKMEGYKAIFESLGDEEIHSISEEFKLNDTKIVLFNYGDKLYKRVNGENTEIGTVADNKLSFFYFDNKIYILDGVKYRSYDGTTLAEVEGYIPKVAINAPPSGGGTNYEQVNLLTGKKYMTFSPDGTTKVFKLPETNLTSIDSVLKNGEEVASSHYTKSTISGTVTFGNDYVPAEGIGTIDIYWTKSDATNRAIIEKCTQAFLFGGASDTRVFLYGNPDTKNREYFSGVTTVPSAEYFPANNYKDIGTNQYAITGMEKQYSRQIIFTERDTYYASIESSTDALGVLNTDFPAYPLNSEIGNIAVKQTSVLLNNPVAIFNDGIYELKSSAVRDERNMNRISERVEADFEDTDLTTAITIDWQENQEYWLHIPSKKMCWIFNYGNNTWYKRSNIEANDFAVIDGELYFASKGTIYKFDKEERTDEGGKTINAFCQLGFQGFNAEWKKKKIKKIWAMLKPQSKAYVRLSYETDRTNKDLIGEIKYNTCDFWEVNFADFSFLTSLSVKPFRLKTRAKKFAYFSLILENDKDRELATVIGIDLKCTAGGEIK